MIPAGSDEDGHSLRMLLQFAIKHFPLAAVYDFVTDKDRIVTRMAASHLMNEKRLG
jgi:hypothetical protein